MNKLPTEVATFYSNQHINMFQNVLKVLTTNSVLANILHPCQFVISSHKNF